MKTRPGSPVHSRPLSRVASLACRTIRILRAIIPVTSLCLALAPICGQAQVPPVATAAQTQLAEALKAGDTTQARRLMSEGTRLVADSVETVGLLMSAIEAKDVARVELLLDAGASPSRGKAASAVGTEPEFPTGAAYRMRSVAIASLLFDRGAIATGTDVWGVQYLMENESGGLYSYQKSREETPDSIALLKLLIDHGADVNTHVPGSTVTPLSRVLTSRQYARAGLLLAAGADPNQRDRDGKSLILRATERDDARAITLLADAGGDPNLADKEGNLPTHVAARSYDMAVIKLLVAKGARLDVANKLGELPADVAHTGEVKSFIVNGRKPDTPERIARRAEIAAALKREFEWDELGYTCEPPDLPEDSGIGSSRSARAYLEQIQAIGDRFKRCAETFRPGAVAIDSLVPVYRILYLEERAIVDRAYDTTLWRINSWGIKDSVDAIREHLDDAARLYARLASEEDDRASTEEANRVAAAETRQWIAGITAQFQTMNRSLRPPERPKIDPYEFAVRVADSKAAEPDRPTSDNSAPHRESASAKHGIAGSDREADRKSSTTASRDSGGGQLPVLTRTDNSKEIADQARLKEQAEAAARKREAEEKAARLLKEARDAQAAKDAEDKHRKFCMAPQNKGDCGCSKYVPPNPLQTVCSK